MGHEVGMGKLASLIQTPEDVLKFVEPTPAVLSPCDSGFKVTHYDMRDESGTNVFALVSSEDHDWGVRRVNLSSDFLKCRVVRSTIAFSVGSEPIQSLRMIERHFFRGDLLRSFDFTFGYCIANSENTREVIYELPRLPQTILDGLAKQPYSVSTDTFFFADDRLVHHIRGEHDYRGWLCSSLAGAAMQSLQTPVKLSQGMRTTNRMDPR